MDKRLFLHPTNGSIRLHLQASGAVKPRSGFEPALERKIRAGVWFFALWS